METQTYDESDVSAVGNGDWKSAGFGCRAKRNAAPDDAVRVDSAGGIVRVFLQVREIVNIICDVAFKTLQNVQ